MKLLFSHREELCALVAFVNDDDLVSNAIGLEEKNII